ncbi:MAG: MBL fold metallo-hydrolase [Dehalococcoidales bacterium]|nr:MBL fold metallo-hydrolase [Dehalococcoidales bacterium]
MRERSYRPGTLTPNIYLLGTPLYPAYLAMGEYGMIIEGGITATAHLLEDQVKELNIAPEKIKYVTLTHTHPDHIGAIPYLKKIWPHLQVIGGTVAAKLLLREEAVKEFLSVDASINENLLIRGEIAEWPEVLDSYAFQVDKIVSDGEKIDLGGGNIWTAYETPGHSSCHMSYHNEKEGITVIGDATGLYDPMRDIFWPNYFNSLDSYCNSIKKLAALPAQIGVVSHNYTLGDVKHHFYKAIKATENFHNKMLERINKGESPEVVALDMAKWVYTFTNLQPFQVIHNMSRLMLKRSQTSTGNPDMFDI